MLPAELNVARIVVGRVRSLRLASTKHRIDSHLSSWACHGFGGKERIRCFMRGSHVCRILQYEILVC